MKKPLAVALLVVLSLIGYSAAVLLSFGSAWYSVILVEDIGSRILFASALPFVTIFAYRLFRDCYGFTMKKFLFVLCMPPYAGSVAVSVVLIVIGIFSGGWGGLGALSIAITWHFAVVGLLVCTIVWAAALDAVDRICRYNVKKIISLIVLTLCSAAVGSGIYRVNTVFPFFAINSVNINTPAIVTALITAVPVSIGLTALMHFYKNEYSLNPPLCLLCIFLPTFLISGAMLANAYFSGGEYYRYSNEFYASRQNLIGITAIFLATAVLYAAFSLIRRGRLQSKTH